MFEKFIEFHKRVKHHYQNDSDSDLSSSRELQSQGLSSFIVLVFCIIFALIGGLIGFRWCKSSLGSK